MIGVNVLLLAAAVSCVLSSKVEPLNSAQRLAYLARAGIAPEQLEALNRYEELRAEHEREIQLQQRQYERELDYLENAEQDSLRQHYAVREEAIQMPGEQPTQNDTYLCTAYKQPSDRYVVAFEPMADSHKIHHILVFGCDAPGINRPMPAWNCGEMTSRVDNQYVKASPCAGVPNVIYAWARGAPKLNLPEGVAFHVGGQTANRFLVLQVHYMHESTERDFSGVKIRFTDEPQPRTASTLLVVTGGEVQPNTKVAFEAACVVDEPVELHPFAFRVHTHRHGERVSGWVVREDEDGKDEWNLIGERSPQAEQLFETVKNPPVIKQNDIIAARCTINNNENHPIQIGPTGEDEMCNYYIMYWVEGDESKTLSDNTCYSPGPPHYQWSREAKLNHIPK